MIKSASHHKLTILSLMANIEKQKGMEFHKLYPVLEKDIMKAMSEDKSLQFYSNKLARIVDDISEGVL